MSGDIRTTCIYTSSTQPWSENLIKDNDMVLVANGKYVGWSVHKRLCTLSIGKFMITWGTEDDSYGWIRYPIGSVISRLFGSRVHLRLVWISQEYNTTGMYDMIWDRNNHWTEVYYIRPDCTMGFWKLIFPVWSPKMIVVDADGNFVGCSRKRFRRPY